MSKIQKGIYCVNCYSYENILSKKSIKCKECADKEPKNQAIQRVALDLRYIYYYHPEKVTTHTIYELCGKTISKRTINRTLKTLYPFINKRPRSYYDIPLL